MFTRQQLDLFRGNSSGSSGDTTPAGAASALLLEDGFGLLLEDGTYLLLEA
jgi:hypothetical protein